MLKTFSKVILFTIILLSNVKIFSQDGLTKAEAQYKSKTLLDKDYYEVTAKYAQILLVNDKQTESFNLLVKNYTTALKLKDHGSYAYLKCIESIQYSVIGEEVKSNLSFSEAKKSIEKTKNAKYKGYFSYTAGWHAIRKKNELEAVNYFLEALRYYDLIEDDYINLKRKSDISDELSRIYADWDDFEMHKKYAYKTLEYALKQDNPDAVFSSYMSIGFYYEKKLKLNPKDETSLKLVEENYLKAIEVYNRNSMSFPSDLSYATTNLAGIYIRYFPDSYKEKAKELVMIAKEIAVTNDEHNHLAAIHSILAEIEIKNNNKATAKVLFTLAIEHLSQSKNKDHNVELYIYEKLFEVETELNNLQSAIEYKKKYISLYKSIYDSEKLEIGKRLEAEYERKIQLKENEKLQLVSEKRRQQIKLLELENLKKQSDIDNLKLKEENNERKLKVSELITQQKLQELKLSQLETESKNNDILYYQEELKFNEKLNTYFIIIIIAVILILFLVLFLLRQRTLKLRMNKKLFKLAIEKEKQRGKINALTSLLGGQEKERERLARDLHDGLGGLLSAIKLQLSDFSNKEDNRHNEELKTINDHLNFAINKLRKVSHNLLPDILIKYGLETALKEFALRMVNNNLEIDVNFLGYTKGLNTEKELFIYRIIQELVNNAIKHANASQIIIQFVEEKNSYHITVEDDGIGFDVNNLEFRNSAGYNNLHSRIQFLKGTFEVNSEKNKGTSFEFNIPKI